eukprot:SAG25_NODE_190_length_12277_cov_10.004927_11_plen_59_part_00
MLQMLSAFWPIGHSPSTHFCRKYVQYSTALPFFLDSGGLGPRDGFVSSAPISCSQLSR